MGALACNTARIGPALRRGRRCMTAAIGRYFGPGVGQVQAHPNRAGDRAAIRSGATSGARPGSDRRPGGWQRGRSESRSRPDPPARRTPASRGSCPITNDPVGRERAQAGPVCHAAGSRVPSPFPHSAPALRPAPCRRPRRHAGPSGVLRRARRSARRRRAWHTSVSPAPNIIGQRDTSCPPGAGMRAIDRRSGVKPQWSHPGHFRHQIHPGPCGIDQYAGRERALRQHPPASRPAIRVIALARAPVTICPPAAFTCRT